MKQLLETAFDVSLDGGAEGRFFSLDMVWLNNPLIRAYVLSSRIAKICVDLLGVPAVRLYHDNLLSKEPRCGRTPWHYDDHHFPLATNDVVTAWIPAQPIPRAMGPLAFAMPIDAYKLVESLEFSKFDTSYDREVARVFQANGLRVEDGPFAMGEVSFHHNLSFHTAAGNRTTASRMVLANTYYADGARVLRSNRPWCRGTGTSSFRAPVPARSLRVRTTPCVGRLNHGSDTFESSLAHWSEAGRTEMDAFYALATADYRVLACAHDWSAWLLNAEKRAGGPLTILDVACGSGKFPTALVKHAGLGGAGLRPVKVTLCLTRHHSRLRRLARHLSRRSLPAKSTSARCKSSRLRPAPSTSFGRPMRSMRSTVGD